MVSTSLDALKAEAQQLVDSDTVIKNRGPLEWTKDVYGEWFAPWPGGYYRYFVIVEVDEV